MRLILGPLVAKIDGSLGGITFKRVAGEIVAQQKSPYRPSHRVRLVNQPMHLAILNRTWHTLTAAQRDAWNLIRIASDPRSKKTKPLRYQSAEALFLSHNLPRLIYGLAQQTTAPTLALTNAPFKAIVRNLSYDWMQIHFEEDPLLSGEYAFFEYSIRQPRSNNTPRTWFQNRVLFTGPKTTVQSIAISPILTTHHCFWTRIRRHSAIALTSPFTEAKVTYG